MSSGRSSRKTTMTCWGRYTSTWVAVLSGRRGATLSGSCIWSHMAGVTCPVTLSAGVPSTSFS